MELELRFFLLLYVTILYIDISLVSFNGIWQWWLRKEPKLVSCVDIKGMALKKHWKTHQSTKILCPFTQKYLYLWRLVTHLNIVCCIFQGKIVECVNCGCRGCSGWFAQWSSIKRIMRRCTFWHIKHYLQLHFVIKIIKKSISKQNGVGSIAYLSRASYVDKFSIHEWVL